MRLVVLITTFVCYFAYAQTVSAATNTMNVDHIRQMPELPRGCEVTSLTMLLRSAGVEYANKMQLAKEVKKVPFRQNGYRGNPYNGFVGNMYTFNQSGYGVYHGPIADLAEQYLPNQIKDLTGGAITDVYAAIDRGTPVWVITNTRFRKLPESQFYYWKTKDGTVKVTYREHSVLVTGYDDQYVYVNDPLYHQRNRKVNRANFEQAWVQMGSQAITYVKREPVNLDVNGDAESFKEMAYKFDQTVYVPVRALAEETGTSLSYIPEKKSIILKQEDAKVVVHLDNGQVSVNNRYIDLKAPIELIDGMTSVPVRLFEKHLGATIQWNGTTNTVFVYTNKKG
ncbi:C39 family peptidase [Bacillus tianshenii]|nr:C39 family peptidase [Bacillus tianshenii]